MKIDHFSMDSFAESREGAAILRTAHNGNAWHIVQRLAPANSHESKDGAYLMMLLDWPNGMIVRMIFDASEMDSLTQALTVLNGMGVFDAFDTEGVVPV